METAGWIAIVAIVSGTLNFWLGYILTQKNKKIELLEQTNTFQDKTIRKQEIANLKLEITGQLANKFFKQLPQIGESDEESG